MHSYLMKHTVIICKTTEQVYLRSVFDFLKPYINKSNNGLLKC